MFPLPIRFSDVLISTWNYKLECCLLCLFSLSFLHVLPVTWFGNGLGWWPWRPAGVHCLSERTNKLRKGDFRNKIPNGESLHMSDFYASNRPEVSSGIDLSASQSSPSSLKGRWVKSAEYSQKIYLNSFLLRYTIWQVLLEFLDRKKYVQWEQLFWESFDTFIPRWAQCKSENYIFKEWRSFNKGLV